MNGDTPRLNDGGAMYSLLRVSYAVAHGALPDGRIERTCGNARCIAPAHMKVVEARPPAPPAPLPQVSVENLAVVRVRVRQRRPGGRWPVMDYVFYGDSPAEARTREARHRTLDRLYAAARAEQDGLDAEEVNRRG